MARVPIDGCKLYYEIEGDGDWLVFAHGGDGNHLCWWKQVAAFKDRYRCLTYDARGYGLSDTSEQAVDAVHSAANDLLALLDHLDIGRAVLVGHSMGGMAVSGISQSRPERVRALVMSDTPFGFQTAALSRWAVQMMDKISDGFDVMENLFAPGYAEREQEMHGLYQAICRMRISELPARPADDRVYEPYRRMRDMAAVDYSAFPVPSLFIVGDQDQLTLPGMMEETAAAVGGAKFVTIPGAGHSPFFEQTELYNAALETFLKDV
ncbi:MAG TPA: alpha/beta hydrolase [Alphaproteobacteria bacterium]|nr:alpha/beta hydrolase [Alphaproteobacteria bacterium]